DASELGRKPQAPLLGHDQHFGVGAIEVPVQHRGVGRIQVNGHTGVVVATAVACPGDYAVNEISGFLRHLRCVPTHDVGAGWPLPKLIRPGAMTVRFKRLLPCRRRPDAVKPTAAIFVPGRGEGRAGQLFGVQTKGAALRRVSPLRQGARKSFRTAVVSESALILQLRHGLSPCARYLLSSLAAWAVVGGSLALNDAAYGRVAHAAFQALSIIHGGVYGEIRSWLAGGIDIVS